MSLHQFLARWFDEISGWLHPNSMIHPFCVFPGKKNSHSCLLGRHLEPRKGSRESSQGEDGMRVQKKKRKSGIDREWKYKEMKRMEVNNISLFLQNTTEIKIIIEKKYNLVSYIKNCQWHVERRQHWKQLQNSIKSLKIQTPFFLQKSTRLCVLE